MELVRFAFLLVTLKSFSVSLLFTCNQKRSSGLFCTVVLNESNATTRSTSVSSAIDNFVESEDGDRILRNRSWHIVSRICSHCEARNATRGLIGNSRSWINVFCSTCENEFSCRENETILALRRRCLQCSKIASFGQPGGKAYEARHCKLHRLVGEVDLRHPHCTFIEGCSRRASYGDREGSLLFCVLHKAPSHFDTLHRRCRAAGCAKRALFGNGTGPPTSCYAHRSPSDRNAATRPCELGCGRTAFYGDPALRRPRFCSRHRGPHDADVVNQMCAWRLGGRCDRQAFYGPPRAAAAFCARHREQDHLRSRVSADPRK